MFHVEGIKDAHKSSAKRGIIDDQRPSLNLNLVWSDHWLLDRTPGFWSETKRAIKISNGLLAAGAVPPASLDLASVLMGDHGLWYLESVCANFDILDIEEFPPPSRWIVICLFRTVRCCYDGMIRQLEGFPVQKLEYYTNLERLTNEINKSPDSFRLYFLLSLSIGGTVQMMEPLIMGGLDISNDATYLLERALQRQNLGTATLLLNHGASLPLDVGAQFLRKLLSSITEFKRSKIMIDLEGFHLFLGPFLEAVGDLRELPSNHSVLKELDRIFLATVASTDLNAFHKIFVERHPCLDKIARLLIESGLFHRLRQPIDYWHQSETPLHSPLMVAMASNNVHVVDLLLKNGYEVDELLPPDAPDWTECNTPPMMYAINLGSLEIVKLLLEAGADVTKQPRMGHPAWMESASLIERQRHSRSKTTDQLGVSNQDICESVDEQIFKMICANLKLKHCIDYEQIKVEYQASSKFRRNHVPGGRKELKRSGKEI